MSPFVLITITIIITFCVDDVSIYRWIKIERGLQGNHKAILVIISGGLSRLTEA